MSFWFDLKILLATVFSLGGHGAVPLGRLLSPHKFHDRRRADRAATGSLEALGKGAGDVPATSSATALPQPYSETGGTLRPFARVHNGAAEERASNRRNAGRSAEAPRPYAAPPDPDDGSRSSPSGPEAGG
jgi:hypothetical protein